MTHSELHFAAILIAIFPAMSTGCNAKSPRAQFIVSDFVSSVAICNDGTLVAVGSRAVEGYQSLTVFDANSRRQVWSVNAGDSVQAVAFSPDKKWLVSGGYSGLKIWDLKGRHAVATLPGPPEALPQVEYLAISPHGKLLATSRGITIQLWDLTRRKLLRCITTTCEGGLAFSPDEKWLALAGSLNRLTIYDVESGSQLGEIHADMGVLGAVDFSPDGRVLAVCNAGRTKIFSIEEKGDEVVLSELAAIPGGQDVDISPNGKWLASGESLVSGNVLIHDVSSGNQIASFPLAGERGFISSVEFSADNARLVVGGKLGRGPLGKGVVQIWNTRDVLGTLSGAAAK